MAIFPRIVFEISHKVQVKTRCCEKIRTLSGSQVIQVTFLAKKCLSDFKGAPPTFLDILEYLVSLEIFEKVSKDPSGLD